MILFITPALRNYRLELFEKLCKNYPIKFIFTSHIQNVEYGGIRVPESWNYEKVNIISDRLFHIVDASNFRNWLHFTKFLLSDNYEIILSSPAENYYNFLSLIISKLRFKKIVFWGEVWYFPYNKFYLKIYHTLIKLMLERGDAVICTGEKSYAFYKKILKNKTAVFFAPNYVIPYKQRDPAELFATLSAKDPKICNKRIILYMSRVIKRKGLDYLINAFKLLEDKGYDFYLLIVGTGDFEEYCRKLADQLQIKNIMFVGYVNDSEIELFYNVCDVFVLPSIFLDDFPEPAGYVVFEAMSVGKPVVVTDAVGARELVINGVNGYVVKERDIIGLSQALSKILIDQKIRENMGIKSKELFKECINLERQFKSFKSAIDYVKQKKHDE